MISKSSGYLKIGNENCKSSILKEVKNPIKITLYKFNLLLLREGMIIPSGNSKNKFISIPSGSNVAIVKGLLNHSLVIRMLNEIFVYESLI